MSGYLDAQTLRLADLNADQAFLQKPFSLMSLVQIVREMLDRGSRGQNYAYRPDR